MSVFILGKLFQVSLEGKYKHKTGQNRRVGLEFHQPAMAARTLYSDDEIADRMEAMRKEKGLSVEEAADLAGMENKWSWYKKADHSTPFKVDEIGLFAAAIGAPRGWPFVGMPEAQALEGLRDRLADILRALATPPSGKTRPGG